MITLRTVNAWDECTSLKTVLIKCTMIFLLFHYFLLLSQINFGLFVILLRVVFGKLAVTYSQEHIKRARCLWVCPWYDFPFPSQLYHFNSFRLYRKGMRSIVALLPLLGVTYTLGYFISFHTVVAYLFILLNSTQVWHFVSLDHYSIFSQRIELYPKSECYITVKSKQSARTFTGLLDKVIRLMHRQDSKL